MWSRKKEEEFSSSWVYKMEYTLNRTLHFSWPFANYQISYSTDALEFPRTCVGNSTWNCALSYNRKTAGNLILLLVNDGLNVIMSSYPCTWNWSTRYIYNVLPSLPPTSDPGFANSESELTNILYSSLYNNIPEPLMTNEVAQKLVVDNKQQIMSQDPRNLIYT